MDKARAVPPQLFVLLSVASTQTGSALAKALFSYVGPLGSVALRVTWAAVFVSLVSLRQFRVKGSSAWAAVILFGIALAAMNLSFYSAIARIPLGIAVALEFVGPLGVAIFGSRRWVDLLWVIFAAAGIALLTPWSGHHIDLAGVYFALLAGLCWAAYIVLGARVGQSVPGLAGLAIGMIIGALVLLPIGVVSEGRHLAEIRPIVLGATVAILSSALPYSLELQALRHMKKRVFGLLLSAEPAVAALAGWLILRQSLGWRDLAAMALIMVATAGSSLKSTTS